MHSFSLCTPATSMAAYWTASAVHPYLLQTPSMRRMYNHVVSKEMSSYLVRINSHWAL